MSMPLEGAMILIADDEAPIREMLQDILEQEGAHTRLTGSGAEALAALTSEDEPDVVILDVRMPPPDGLAVLQQIRSRGVDVPVLIITAQDSSTMTIEAMRQGAYDYLAKPFDTDEILHTVQRALEHRRLTRRVTTLEMRVATDARDILVGRSAPMQQVYKLIGRVAASDATVLITGESGTGKKLVAQALHRNSLRSEGPLVVINCAGLPDSLLEGELFGHPKDDTQRPRAGSATLIDPTVLRATLIDTFSESELRTFCFDLPLQPRIQYDDLPGASRADKIRELVAYCERRSLLDQLAAQLQIERPHVQAMRPNQKLVPSSGQIQQAEQGTLVLTEVHETSPSIQRRLLRVLQERKIDLGNGPALPVDVRIIATSSIDLIEAVNSGSFRRDLYYRLNVVNLRVPPLRERIEDMPLLAHHFLELYRRRAGMPYVRIEENALALLMSYDWPGNVRQLENTIKRAAMVSNGIINVAGLTVAREHQSTLIDITDRLRQGQTLPEVLAYVRQTMIAEAFHLFGGNRAAAARALGIEQSALGEA